MLVDSAACIHRVYEVWARRHGLAPADVIAIAHGRRTIETVRHVVPHLDAAAEAKLLAAEEAVTTEGIFEVPGARELLDAVPATRWAVVTSGVRAVATLRLRTTGLPSPRVLVSADDVRRGKPDPEGYLAAAAALGFAAADCVVVEDAPAGLAAAHAAGMRSIGVLGTYGAPALSAATFTVPKLGALRVRTREGDQSLTVDVAAA